MDAAIKTSDLLKDALAAELGSNVILDADHYTPPLSFQTKLITIDGPTDLPTPVPSLDDVDSSTVVYTIDVTIVVVR